MTVFLSAFDLQKIIFWLLAGMVLGIFHFGGLWITLEKFSRTRFYALIFITSFLLRSLVTLSGIFILGNGNWVGMAVCLGGVLIMRKIIIIKIRKPLISNVKELPKKGSTV